MNDSNTGNVPSTLVAMLAGALGGVLVVGVLAAIAFKLVPRLMPKMMGRMMAGGECSERMRDCMEKCGCGPATDAAE